MKRQRKYNVTFEILKTGCTRTVMVTTTDSLSAARIVYANFGGKKIKVTSAKVVKENEV
jgi:hypothetical protein